MNIINSLIQFRLTKIYKGPEGRIWISVMPQVFSQIIKAIDSLKTMGVKIVCKVKVNIYPILSIVVLEIFKIENSNSLWI